ncbi:hypothetical protein J4Q44_G00019590 [Coregonus suidteri]|uniref:Alpha-endosulfine n=1 Tax=Coregonus suidteri TaxID=861788 RepID=A0AAN8R7S4_9TELE
MTSENLSDTQMEYEDEKQDSQEKNANLVKGEEVKLKAKYPGLGQKPGGSDFLMKRLQKGQKYFDLRRLQHGQGKDEEQTAARGGARQEPRHRGPHSHATGPAPEEGPPE